MFYENCNNNNNNNNNVNFVTNAVQLPVALSSCCCPLYVQRIAQACTLAADVVHKKQVYFYTKGTFSNHSLIAYFPYLEKNIVCDVTSRATVFLPPPPLPKFATEVVMNIFSL